MGKDFIRSLLFMSILSVPLLISGCLPPSGPSEKDRPIVILTNSAGEKDIGFMPLDAVFGSFSNLKPSTYYDIYLMRSDGMEISHSAFTSNDRGIIATTPLWWDIGVEYSNSRTGKLDLKTLRDFKYNCVLKVKNKTISTTPVILDTSLFLKPFIYSSDENGNPLNGFIHKRESVYLSGRNIPPGSTLHIYIVQYGYSWEYGTRLEPVLEKVQIYKLSEDQQNFTTLIWPAKRSIIGSYDLIVEYRDHNGRFDIIDLIDFRNGAGFTFFCGPPSPPTPSGHIEEDIACQAPPHDNAGNVIGAPNPIYKDIFSTTEEVWVAVNPKAGGGNYVGQSARIYVVDHKLEADWTDGAALNDVDGSTGYETTTIQPGCANVNYTWVMNNPPVKSYDVIVDFAPFGVYNKGMDIIDKLDDIGFDVPSLWISLESITFNHTTSSNSGDAINIRKDFSTDVTVPEWQKAKQSDPAAYIINKSVTIKAIISAAPGVTSAKIRASKQYGFLGDLNQKVVSFSGGSPQEVSFTVSGKTPNDIRKSNQKWHWLVEDINNTGTAEQKFAGSVNKLYSILAQPQSPWDVSGNKEPWVKALNRSCSWANGQSTPEGAADNITRQLFGNVGGKYDIVSGAPKYGYSPFHLNSFLNKIPNISTVNCYDMGHSLVSMANAVGCNLSYRFSQPFGYLNCIHPIGQGWANNPFYGNSNYSSNPIVNGDWTIADGRSRFGNHAFGSISDNIFDACLTVDTDSDPDFGPPFTETWMINQVWNSYKAKVVDNNPSTNTSYPSIETFNIN
jgi:hypothetical protein